MKSKIIGAAAAGLLLLGQGAWAEEFTPAAHARYVVDLDTPDASMSLWRLDDLSGINALRTQATFVRLGKKTQWGPQTIIVLANDRSEVKLTFVMSSKGSVALLTATRGETKLGTELFLMPIDPQETFGLEMDWTAEGKVTVRITTRAVKEMGGQGFELHDVTMDGAPTQMKILGGGNETEFKPLTLGVVR